MLLHSVKKYIKKKLLSLVFQKNHKIVIASTGRAASTMLVDAVAESLVQHKFHLRSNNSLARIVKNRLMGYVDRIITLPDESCVICKTHDTYDCPPTTEFKYVFVYGDPLDSAKSVEKIVEREGKQWFELHQYHLKASGNYSDLFQVDVLNYQGQIKSWMSFKHRNVICIDYDDLWKKNDLLTDFLGFEVKLPERKLRLPKREIKDINYEFFESLRDLKNDLKQKYESSIWM